MGKVAAIVVSVIFLVAIFGGYDKFQEYRHNKQVIKKQNEKQTSDNFDRWLNEASYRKPAVLLSIKYNVEESKLFSMLAELESLKNAKVDSAENVSHITRKVMDTLSAKYAIPVTVLANVIIDYYYIKRDDMDSDI